MGFPAIDRCAPMVGAIVIEGFQVLANYRDEHILARSLNTKSQEPFVVWTLDSDGDPHTGSYCADVKTAEVEFVERCFPWFWEEQMEAAEDATQTPEQRIDFQQEYPTHRIGFYHGWMIVQPHDELDGEIRCYPPSDEWDGTDFPDLDFTKDMYTSEWDAGSLQEAVDFINSY